MIDVPIAHVLLFAVVLFALGLMGVLVRRNALFMLLGVEIMLNAGGVAFVGAGAGRGEPDGQVMFVFTLAIAAAEAAVGLAVILRLRLREGTVDTDATRSLRG